MCTKLDSFKGSGCPIVPTGKNVACAKKKKQKQKLREWNIATGKCEKFNCL